MKPTSHVRSRRHHRWLLLLLLVGPDRPDEAVAQAHGSGRQVYDRAELEAAGIQRWSDLLGWLEGWSYTLDGISGGIDADGLPGAALAPAGVPAWLVLVNGQRVPVERLGGQLLEFLPVAIAQVDSVEIEPSPGMAGGRFASRGTIRIHARRAPPGPAIRLGYRNGSETRDPGPYLWTEDASPNVDRTGPDGWGTVSYRGNGWDGEAAIRYLRNPSTDERLHDEFRTIWFQPFTYVWGPSLRVGVDALGGRHELLAGHVDHDGFAYAPLSGQFENSQAALTHAGITGDLRFTGELRGRYRLTHSRLGWEKRTDLYPPRPIERRRTSHASLEVTRETGPLRLTGGIGVDVRSVEWQGAKEGERRPEGTAFVEARHRPIRTLAYSGALALTRVGGRTAPRGTLGFTWNPAANAELSASVAASRVLPGEGSGWIDALTVSPKEPRGVPERVLLWSGLTWRRRVGSAVSVAVGGIYGFLDQRAPERRPPRPGTADGASGGRFGGSAAVEWKPGSRVRARLHYASIAPLGASEELSSALETLPGHLLRGTATYRPFRDVRLHALFHRRSATEWNGSGAPGAGRVPPFVRIDLGAEKWFWDERIRAQLTIRNVLDEPERYHPSGAALALRYFVGASVMLPGAPAAAGRTAGGDRPMIPPGTSFAPEELAGAVASSRRAGRSR